MAIMDRPEEALTQTPTDDSGAAEAIKTGLGAVHSAGEAVVERVGTAAKAVAPYVMPVLEPAVFVLDIPFNTVRGMWAGKDFVTALTEYTGADKIKDLEEKPSDSPDIKVLKRAAQFGIEYLGPTLPLGMAGKALLRSSRNAAVKVEMDVATGAGKPVLDDGDLLFKTEDGYWSANGQSEKELAKQERKQARERKQSKKFAQKLKEEGAKREPKPSVTDQEIDGSALGPIQAQKVKPGDPASTATLKSVKDHIEFNEAKGDHWLDTHGETLMKGENVKPKTLNQMKNIILTGVRLKSSFKATGSTFGRGLAFFRHWKEELRSRRIDKNMAHLFKNYSTKDVFRMLHLYRKETGHHWTQFAQEFEKPGFADMLLESGLGHILGPASLTAALFSTQMWMFSRALDLEVANSKAFRATLGKGIEAERHAHAGRHFAMGAFVDAPLDLLRTGYFYTHQRLLKGSAAERLFPIPKLEWMNGLSRATAIAQRVKLLKQFTQQSRMRFGLQRKVVTADNIPDWVPFGESAIIRGAANAWGGVSRFFPQAIGYLDVGARYMALRGMRNVAWHQHSASLALSKRPGIGTPAQVSKQSKAEGMNYLERHPQEFKITNMTKGGESTYVHAATEFADQATMSVPIPHAQALLKNPLLRLGIHPYPDVALRQVELTVARIPILTRLIPTTQKLLQRGGEGRMIHRAAMFNAQVIGTSGLVLHQFGYLSGSGPKDPDLRDSYAEGLGQRPMSLTVGNLNLDLRRTGPFGAYSTWMADINDHLRWLPPDRQQDWWNAALMVLADHVVGESILPEFADTWQAIRGLEQDNFDPRKRMIPNFLLNQVLPTGSLRWWNDLSKDSRDARMARDTLVDGIRAELAKLGIFDMNKEYASLFPKWLAEWSGLSRVANAPETLPVHMNWLGYIQWSGGAGWTDDGTNFIPSMIKRVPPQLPKDKRERIATVTDELIRLGISPRDLDPQLDGIKTELKVPHQMLLRALRNHPDNSLSTYGTEDGKRVRRTLEEALWWTITKSEYYQTLPYPYTEAQERESTVHGEEIGLKREMMAGSSEIGQAESRENEIRAVFRAYNNHLSSIVDPDTQRNIIQDLQLEYQQADFKKEEYRRNQPSLPPTITGGQQ